MCRDKKCIGILDTGSSGIIAPEEEGNLLNDNFGRLFKYGMMNAPFFCDIKKMHDLIFRINNVDYYVEANKFIIEVIFF